MDPTHITTPELLGHQCLYQITLRYLQNMGNYWDYHLPSTITIEFYEQINLAVNLVITLVTAHTKHPLCIGTRTNPYSDLMP